MHKANMSAVWNDAGDLMEPNTPMRYTAPNGSKFDCIVVTGRVDAVFGDVLVRHDSDGRLVWAHPVRLEPIPAKN